ncbi:MAG: cytochrome c oxidase subunit II [Chloroflexaceae bacterium]|nr:cytochrome c oxidase subunit II [Chloroflexaceae bacterium]
MLQPPNVKRVPALLASLLVLFTLFNVSPTFAQSASTPSPLLPASPGADLVANLFWVVFWMSVGVFILVEGLLIYSAVKFRRRSPNEMPAQVHGNTRLELAWTIGPSLIAVAIFALSLQVMLTIQDPGADSVALASSNVCFSSDISPNAAAAFVGTSTLDIDVTGYQWWWEYNYPAYGLITAADMYVPVGAIVKLNLTSRDVVHAWWIPQLGGKKDLYPGAINLTWFQVTEPGVYEGHCTELCGASHAYMPMRVIALEQAEFDAWVNKQLEGPAAPETELALQGQQLMRSKGCLGCHAVTGLSESARVGPNLTNLAERHQVAGLMPYSQENIRLWLSNPAGTKPGALMPNLNLSEAELDALTAYLDTLK